MGEVLCRQEVGESAGRSTRMEPRSRMRGLFGLPTDENQPQGGLQRADRFIHHVQWEHPFLLCPPDRGNVGVSLL